MRSVAAAAGVDPALVHHYFGGKDDLFVASLAIPVDPRTVFAVVAAEGPDGAGERLLRGFLSVWDDPALQVPMIGFARGLLDPSASELVKDGFLRGGDQAARARHSASTTRVGGCRWWPAR